MMLDFSNGGTALSSVNVPDGVAHQVDPVTALAEAARGLVHADFRDYTVENDLAVSAQATKQIFDVGIGEDVGGLFFDDELPIRTEVCREIDPAIRNHITVG